MTNVDKTFTVLSIIIAVLLIFVLCSGCKTKASEGEHWLTWTAVDSDRESSGIEDCLDGPATSYDIRYGTDSITAANWELQTRLYGEPIPSSCGSIDSFLVVGLQPSTTYRFAMTVSDSLGNTSSLSNLYELTTTDFEPPNAINDLSGHN